MKAAGTHNHSRSKVLTNIPVVLLAVILLFAAYLRLYRISEYMTYLGDEGRDMLVVKRMIVDGKFTLLGPTASVGGFFLGPVYYYFMAPFVWLWRLDPSGAAVMVALFGVATVYAVYRLGRLISGEATGLIAAALYTVSPLVIAYSRSSWNPNLVPFFSVVLMYALIRSVQSRDMRWMFAAGAAFGIGLQLHYVFLFLVPVVVLWLLLFARFTHPVRQILSGIAGFVVGFGPFLAFELRHGFPNSISIYNFLRGGEGAGLSFQTFFSTVGNVLYRLTGRLILRYPPPEQLVNLPPQVQDLFHWATVCAIGIPFIFLVTRYIRDRASRPLVSALLLWWLVPSAMFGLYKKAIYDYYFGIMFAVPFLAIAVLFERAAKNVISRFVFSMLIVGLLWFNWMGRPFVHIPNNQLGQARMIADAALSKTGGEPFNFALMANFNSDHAYRYFFEISGNPPVTIENFEKDPQRRSVTNQLIVICELSECKPLGNSLWEIAGFGRAEIAGEWQVSFVKILRLVHYSEGVTP